MLNKLSVYKEFLKTHNILFECVYQISLNILIKVE